MKVELTAAQLLTLTGFQLALHFDERLLDFNGIGLNGSLTMDESNFGLNHISKGIVTSSWNNPYGEKIAKSETLFELNFIAIKKGNLADLIQLNEQKIPAELYTLDERIYHHLFYNLFCLWVNTLIF